MVGLAALLLFAGSPALRAAQPGDKDLPMKVQQAKDQVTQYLAKLGGTKQPVIKWMDDPALKEVFPTVTFFGVRFPQFPLAFAPPKGLASSNVFAVGNMGELQVMTGADDLPKFFLTAYQATKAKPTEKSAATVVRAWLKISEELLQDGFYTFEVVKAQGKLKGNKVIEAEGQSMVTKGGNGSIQVTMELGLDGTLKAGQDYKLNAGPRPKCQATKLLDPDPIVRHMAESELLFMGLAARPYLLEMHARIADPALRQAIDRILHRIEAVGW
jgi:hypothetical protein